MEKQLSKLKSAKYETQIDTIHVLNIAEPIVISSSLNQNGKVIIINEKSMIIRNESIKGYKSEEHNYFFQNDSLIGLEIIDSKRYPNDNNIIGTVYLKNNNPFYKRKFHDIDFDPLILRSAELLIASYKMKGKK